MLDGDVPDCFGSIDDDAFISLVERRASDREMLTLIRAWLREMSPGFPCQTASR